MKNRGLSPWPWRCQSDTAHSCEEQIVFVVLAKNVSKISWWTDQFAICVTESKINLFRQIKNFKYIINQTLFKCKQTQLDFSNCVDEFSYALSFLFINHDFTRPTEAKLREPVSLYPIGPFRIPLFPQSDWLLFFRSRWNRVISHLILRPNGMLIIIYCTSSLCFFRFFQLPASDFFNKIQG